MEELLRARGASNWRHPTKIRMPDLPISRKQLSTESYISLGPARWKKSRDPISGHRQHQERALLPRWLRLRSKKSLLLIRVWPRERGQGLPKISDTGYKRIQERSMQSGSSKPSARCSHDCLRARIPPHGHNQQQQCRRSDGNTKERVNSTLKVLGWAKNQQGRCPKILWRIELHDSTLWRNKLWNRSSHRAL